MCRTLRRAQELARKDAEIAEQKQKMEDMAVEFGEMLKETLDKARAPAAPPARARSHRTTARVQGTEGRGEWRPNVLRVARATERGCSGERP